MTHFLGQGRAMKRSAEDEQVVEVVAFSRAWRFSSGITAQEVVDFVAGRQAVAVQGIAILDRDTSAILAKQSVLAPGRRYMITAVRKPDTAPRRAFAVGGIVDRRKHFYVEPDVTLLVEKLQGARYCALYGARQSGKSTMAMAAKEKLAMDPDVCVVYLDKVTVDARWSRGSFWACIWDHLHGKCGFLFPPRPAGDTCSEWSFKSLFLCDKLPLKVTLIIDEADTFLQASNECLDEFFSTIKGLRDDPDYNLNGILLVGVETIKDLLEAQYHRRRSDAKLEKREYKASLTPSRQSPFSHSFTTEPSRFSVDDVRSLLRQAESEMPGVTIDIDRIALSVVELTGGHKGIVGSCLDHLINGELWTSRRWIEEAESSSRLVNYVFGQQTYSRILISFKKYAADREHSELFHALLRNGACLCDAEGLLNWRDCIAEGVLIAQQLDVDDFLLRFSSPMLRNVILRRCVITSDTVDAPPDPHNLDSLWVILQAIKTMDGEALCRPECLKAGGQICEYAYHFMLFARIKSVIAQVYQSTGAKVLPECKQAVEYLEKRTSQERLDILVRDGDNFSKFGCELVVNDDLDGHMTRAVRYATEHSATVYVIAFTLQAEPEMRVPEHGSVVFVSVRLNPSDNQSTAEVTIVDVSGRPTHVALELKKWTGNISLDVSRNPIKQPHFFSN